MENARKVEFEDLSRVYLTLDLWTNRKMMFLGATDHFINSDWELKSRVLAHDVFDGRHTAYNIARAYVIRGKVKKAVANKASSMVKSFDVSLSRFQADEHGDASAHLDDLGEADIVEEDIEVLPERMNCFAHTEKLCARDGLNHPEVKVSFWGIVLQKMSSLLSSVRRSTSAKAVSLHFSNVTRWNSELKMMKSILKIS